MYIEKRKDGRGIKYYLSHSFREGNKVHKIRKFLGKNMNIFVNKNLGNNLYEARDGNYSIVLINSDTDILGKELEVLIKQVGVHHMIGEEI